MVSARAFVRSLRSTLAIPEKVAPRNRRAFAVGLVIVLFGAALHLGMTILFGFLRIYLLLYLNIAVVCLYVACVPLVWREKYQAWMRITGIESWLHQALCVFLLGWRAGFQYYLINSIVVPHLLRRVYPKGVTSSSLFSALLLPTLGLASVFVGPIYYIPEGILYSVHFLNLLLACIFIGGIALYFSRAVDTAEDAAEKNYESAERLLRNVLPDTVATELSLRGSYRPVRIESATILFSDFVGFSQATSGIDPVSVISYLDRYFSEFDSIARRHQVERLKTIGDGYMCAGGIPEISRTHTIDVCLAALEMRDVVRSAKRNADGIAWDVRIGINTGSVIAGIVGKAKFSYDIWGEAVNLASRHESSGIAGSINVSKYTYLLTKGFFDYGARGEIEIKGGQRMEMYELLGVKQRFRDVQGVNHLFHETRERVAKGELLLGYDI